MDKVREVERVEELKALVASIAHNRSVSRLRERFAKKRGAGKTESLEVLQSNEGDPIELPGGMSPLAALAQTELASLLTEVQRELNQDQRAVLSDFFLHGLSYEDVAKKRGLAVIDKSKPDAVEVLPGVAFLQVPERFADLPIPCIAGGLIRTPETVRQILAAGCKATSTSNVKLWELNGRMTR